MKGLFLTIVGVGLIVFFSCMFEGHTKDNWKPIGIFFVVMASLLVFCGGAASVDIRATMENMGETALFVEVSDEFQRG